MQRTKGRESIQSQIEERVNAPKEKVEEYKGNIERMTSTGSTLLDLAISGGRVRGGGIPGGILVEISGQESTGKTVLLCEIAGAIQRGGGEVSFHDPEARLNTQFARIFDLNTDDMQYLTPDTVTELFTEARKWIPDNGQVNGIVADSLAALSTEMELKDDDGDKMGMRRAKEFSEQLRRTCRILKQTNTIMVCSNQLRENVDRVGKFSAKYKTPGGKGIPYYSSLRLRTDKTGSLTRSRTVKKVEYKHIYAIEIEVEVFKSSIWIPSRTAPVTIDFEYGIDDVRQNLKYVKFVTGASEFKVGDTKLGTKVGDAISAVEKDDLEDQLREQVIDLWEEIEEAFKVERKPKKR